MGEPTKMKVPNNYKYIAVFLTMRCQLNCSFCLNKLDNEKFNRNKFKEISGKEWVEALNKLDSEIPISISGGEPMVHKDLIYIINNLKSSLNIDLLTNF